MKRHIVILVCIGMLGSAVGAGAATGFTYYKYRTRLESVRNPRLTLGIRPYTAHVVIESVNRENRTIRALVYTHAARQRLMMELVYDDALIVEREDAIVEDGIIVGARPLESASLDDLRLDTHGLAVLDLVNGSHVLRYITIGSPPVRP